MAAGLLTSAASAQDTPPVDRASPASPVWWSTHFDLRALSAAAPPSDRDATAGGDAEIAPDVVAGIGAADRQRGATAATETVAPLFQRQAQLSGRLGLLVGTHGLLFGRVGYSEFDLNEAFSRPGSRALSTGGVLVGAGAEAALSPNLSFRTEYHSVDYRSDLSDRQLLGGLAWRY